MKQKESRKGIAIHYPHNIARTYEQDLIAYVHDVKLLISKNLINKDSFTSRFKFAIRKDDISDELDTIIQNINVQLGLKTARVIANLFKYASGVNVFNKNIFLRFIDSVQEQNDKIQSEIKFWVIENIRLVKSISEMMLDRIVFAVHTSISNIENISTLKSAIKKVFLFGENRAKLIAQDQIGKLNSNITKQRNLSLGITKYSWLTGRDERVRHSHQVLEGKICDWNDAALYKNNIKDQKWCKKSSINGVEKHPGEDFNCRCTSISIIPSGLVV